MPTPPIHGPTMRGRRFCIDWRANALVRRPSDSERPTTANVAGTDSDSQEPMRNEFMISELWPQYAAFRHETTPLYFVSPSVT